VDGGWSPWTMVPGNYALDPTTGPSVAYFQGELYVFRTSGQQMYVIVRSANGEWTDWSEVPGGGQTLRAVAAVGAAPGDPAGLFYTPSSATNWAAWRSHFPLAGQMHLLSTDVFDQAYVQAVSETGTWGANWSLLGGSMGLQTNRPLALACALNWWGGGGANSNQAPRLYAFAKDLSSGEILIAYDGFP